MPHTVSALILPPMILSSTTVTTTKKNSWLPHVNVPLHTELKRKRKRKFALMFVAYYCPQRSCGKVMFSQASVILSTGGFRQTPPGQISSPPPGDGDCNAFLLPPAMKLGQGYVFTGVCHSAKRGGGEYLTRYTPKGQGTPQTRYTPLDQVHPPGPGTPPRPGVPPGTRYTPPTRYTPQDQVHPSGTRNTPLGPGTPPWDQVPPRTRYTPRHRACWEIRSTRGRYASYWNATCCLIFFLVV